MNNLPQITAILKKYGIKEAGVFGSVARGEDRPTSDIDIMIQMGKTLNLFEYARLQIDLEKSTGKKVDLVSKNHIKPRLKPYIMKDMIPLAL